MRRLPIYLQPVWGTVHFVTEVRLLGWIALRSTLAAMFRSALWWIAASPLRLFLWLRWGLAALNPCWSRHGCQSSTRIPALHWRRTANIIALAGDRSSCCRARSRSLCM